LREAYRTEEGAIDYRCAGEPVTTYAAKGGKPENTAGRKCLCNGLMANIGLAQVRAGNRVERGLITSGDDVTSLGAFLDQGPVYSAAHVVAKLTACC
jgi:nitronate monooxygenase